MPRFRVLKRKNNEIEYFTEEQRERYINRILIINALLVGGLLLAIILI